MRITRSAAAGSCWAEVYFDGIGWLPVDVTPGYYYDAVKLQQMVATPDMVHKTLAEDHNLMDAEQITDTGNNPAPSHAAMIPAIRATAPEIGDCVACRMAGKVITASVT